MNTISPSATRSSSKSEESSWLFWLVSAQTLCITAWNLFSLLNFTYSTSAIGAFFGVFLAGTLLVGVASLCIPEKWEKRGFIIAVLWVNVGAAPLIGPSRVLHLHISSREGAHALSLQATFCGRSEGGMAEFQSQDDRIWISFQAFAC